MRDTAGWADRSRLPTNEPNQEMQPTTPRRYIFMSILFLNRQFAATCARLSRR
jgi:hypothetical protein